MGDNNGGAPLNVYFANLQPGDTFAVSRASDHFFRLVRFIGKATDGGWAFEELSEFGQACRPTFSQEGLVSAFAGARIEHIGQLTDRDWDMLEVFLRFMTEHGLGPDELARCFVLFIHMRGALADMAERRRAG